MSNVNSEMTTVATQAFNPLPRMIYRENSQILKPGQAYEPPFFRNLQGYTQPHG